MTLQFRNYFFFVKSNIRVTKAQNMKNFIENWSTFSIPGPEGIIAQRRCQLPSVQISVYNFIYKELAEHWINCTEKKKISE